MVILDSDHYVFSVCEKVEELAQPLKLFDINFICFIRVFSDGSRIILCNSGEWIWHFFDHELYQFPILGYHDHAKNINTPLTFLLSIGLPYIPDMVRSFNQFDISSFCVLIERSNHYVDYMYYASHRRDRQITNLYVNNVESLKSYLNYFRIAADKYINQFYMHKIIVPQPENIIDDKPCIFNQKKIKNFYKSINDYLSFDQKINELFFTTREEECIRLLLNGFSAKKIGENLSISQRTVETHINKIKSKVGCNKKSDLIERLLSIPHLTKANHDR